MPIDSFPNRYPMVPPVPEQENPQAPASTDFKELKDRVTKLANNWRDEVDQTQVRRDLKNMRVDVEEKRRTGEFKADEIYIPVPVIRDNIIKEQAQYVTYLTSRNTAIFQATHNSELETQPVEEWFTKISRYPGWQYPFIQVTDGSQTHGWDFVEVVLDSDKPGHFSTEHIAHENLWFPFDLELKAIQDCPIFVRDCKVTKQRLEKFNGVNLEQVEKLFKDTQNQIEVQATQKIQKVFYKKDGVVWVCWMSYNKCDDYIREPRPLYLGRKRLVFDDQTGQMISNDDIYESNYPLFVLPYIISENGTLRDIKGRAFFDEYIQEACSSMVSAIVNGYHRASLIMGAPKNGSSSGGAMEQTDCPIEGGRWYNQPGEFFNMPYPDESGMNIVNAMLTQNKAVTNQVNYAVGNRGDYSSRKTAAEINSAKSDAAILSGVQVTLYSIFLRDVYTLHWQIAQSRAQQGLLDDTTLASRYLYENYVLQPAGDVEVIKREEQKAAIQQSWPEVANTPAAQPMLEDLLSMLFPSRAPIYIAALRKGDPRNMVAALAGILGSIVQQHPQVIPQNQLPQVAGILDQAHKLTAIDINSNDNSTNSGAEGATQNPAQ